MFLTISGSDMGVAGLKIPELKEKTETSWKNLQDTEKAGLRGFAECLP